MKQITAHQSYVKLTKKKIAQAIKEGYIVYHNISWDTDGRKVKLPKAVGFKKSDFDEDFVHELEGADLLSDIYEFCVNSFDIN